MLSPAVSPRRISLCPAEAFDQALAYPGQASGAPWEPGVVRSRHDPAQFALGEALREPAPAVLRADAAFGLGAVVVPGRKPALAACSVRAAVESDPFPAATISRTSRVALSFLWAGTERRSQL
jgi:hypothetical protein